jgi:hypothetical protein
VSEFHEPSYAAGFDEGWRTASDPDLGERVVKTSEAEALAEALERMPLWADPDAAQALADYRARHPKETA